MDELLCVKDNLSIDKKRALHKGLVIPAHPLAVDRNRKLDERRQRALSRYYLDAGAGGLAIGVHTTQFAIRNPGVDLFEPVLNLAREEMDRFEERTGHQVVRIAGVVGRTAQAVIEAELVASLGYDAALLSLSAWKEATNAEVIAHCRRIADILPIVGFYMQTAVGGRLLDVDFWREFASIENVVAIKIAPFNRYQTFDVVRGVAESGRADDIALYTGNDDSIVNDLVSPYRIFSSGNTVTKRFVGGLLGHWSVWTRKAVELVSHIHSGVLKKDPAGLLELGNAITDCNAAFFDAANNFAGCIVGLHEVLRRQGLLEGLWTLDESEKLTTGQLAEIDRVYAAYPELNDDAFVAENRDRWLA